MPFIHCRPAAAPYLNCVLFMSTPPRKQRRLWISVLQPLKPGRTELVGISRDNLLSGGSRTCGDEDFLLATECLSKTPHRYKCYGLVGWHWGKDKKRVDAVSGRRRYATPECSHLPGMSQSCRYHLCSGYVN